LGKNEQSNCFSFTTVYRRERERERERERKRKKRERVCGRYFEYVSLRNTVGMGMYV
jgi:hypothetical protein